MILWVSFIYLFFFFCIIVSIKIFLPEEYATNRYSNILNIIVFIVKICLLLNSVDDYVKTVESTLMFFDKKFFVDLTNNIVTFFKNFTFFLKILRKLFGLLFVTLDLITLLL